MTGEQKPNQTRSRFAAQAKLGAVLVLCLAIGQLSGCARKGAGLVSTCTLPDDQVGTLSGRWKAPPVPIAFHTGDFTAEEMSEIIQAASTWNSFYAQTLGLSPIDFGTTANPRQVSTSRPNSTYVCSQSIVTESTGAFSSQVVLYKLGVWPYPSQPNAMALTTFCKGAGSPLPLFNMAIIEFNYQSFWVSGKKVPDLQTIILHEFGHLLGLNHSCEQSSPGSGTPLCGASTDYSAAVMAPVFTFNSSGYGESKRALTGNDQGRANCIYSYTP